MRKDKGTILYIGGNTRWNFGACWHIYCPIWVTSMRSTQVSLAAHLGHKMSEMRVTYVCGFIRDLDTAGIKMVLSNSNNNIHKFLKSLHMNYLICGQ